MTQQVTSITEDTLRALSTARGEPEWLLQRRLDAWRAYEGMAMPAAWEEEWRRTDLRPLDLDAALASVGATKRSTPVRVPRALAGTKDHAGLIVQSDGETLSRYVAADLPPGVVFIDLPAAVRDNAALLQEKLHGVVLPTEWKLQALQAALWQGGALVYVPRNVELTLPLRLASTFAGPMLTSHLIIIAEANSSVSVVQDQLSADSDKQSLHLGAVEVYAAADARVRYVEVQRWGSGAFNLSTIRANVERGARFTAGLVALGSRLTKTKLDAELIGEGASTELLGLTFGDTKRHFDFTTLQDHVAPHTASDLLFKAALTDTSSQVWNGTVRVQKGAKQSDANQTSRNLLLSDHAKAAPIPVLEIEEFDILRCSHGATAGPVDEEQRYYLESRGIPPVAAERLLVEAFFREVIDRIPVATVRTSVEETIAAKLGAAS